MARRTPSGRCRACRPTKYPYDYTQGYSPMVTYMQELLDYLDRRPDVARYAWW
jgi:hypothetical protein